MAKFNGSRSGRTTRGVQDKWSPSPSGPGTTTGSVTNHAGGVGHTRDVRSELVMLAVVNMVGESTFYEDAKSRDNRFRDLVQHVAVMDDDTTWMIDFTRWLRNEANMRSASIVVAAESVHARLLKGLKGGNRQLIDAAISRADEPGEMLSYWLGRFSKGSDLPKPVKRGVADAARRLYTERTFLKWDSSKSSVRFGDVLALTHPKPRFGGDFNQNMLFRHILDARHGRPRPVEQLERDGGLPTIVQNIVLREYARTLPSTFENAILTTDVVSRAGMTWEDVLSIGGQINMNKTMLWESVIPSMGYMALLRNLRNFDENNVSDETANRVIAKLTDPDEVARSRQFPFRFLSAYREAPSLRWSYALDQALSLSCANVPSFAGRTLVVVDTSGSMQGKVSARSQISYVDVGAVFGAVLAKKGADVTLVGFADGSFEHTLPKGGSVIAEAQKFTQRIGEVGHGTQTIRAMQKHYNGHDRVVLISDMQCFSHGGYGNYGGYGWTDTYGHRHDPDLTLSTSIPENVPFFSVNVAGYATSGVDMSKPNRYEIGGFSDKLFTVMDLLSRGVDATWPWEVASDV